MELRHGFEFLAPNWGHVSRLLNVFRFCLVIVATSSRCACLPVSSVESGLSDVLSNNSLRRRIGEVRWSNLVLLDLSLFLSRNLRQNSAVHMILSPLPVHRFRPLSIPSSPARAFSTTSDEVRWSTVGPSRFVPFRVPNHVQPHKKPSGKKSAAHMTLSPVPMYRFRPMYIPLLFLAFSTTL